MPDTLAIGSAIPLTPDQIAAAQPAESLAVGAQVKLSPDQISAAQPVRLDPLRDFTAEQLASLEKQDPENFNIIQHYAPRTELQQVPGMNQKIADAYHITRQTPLLDTLAPGNGALSRTGGALRQGAGAVWDIAKGAAHTVSNLVQAGATVLTAPVYAALTGDETASGMLTQAERQLREQGAAAEKGVGELGKQIEHGAHAGARLIGAEKPLAQYTPEERVAELFSAMRNAKKFGDISAGRGPISQTVFGPGSAQVAPGVSVRPESVNGLLDPVSWELMGAGFRGAGALVPKAASEAAGNIAAGAGNLAARAGGQALETAADVTGLGARAVATVAPASAATIGAIKGAALHGPAGLITGAGLGYKAGQALAEGAKNISKKAEIASGIGEQIAGKIPMVSPYAQLGADVLQSAPAAAGEIAKGTAFDLGLAAASSEEAPAERSGVGIGTAFGLLGAGKTLGQRVLSGQIIAPREYGSKTSVPPSGQFPALDAVNQASISGSDPGTIAHVNAIKLFARGIDPNAEVFYGKDQAALEGALKQSGMSDADAKNYANAEGFFTTSLPGADGNAKRIIVMRNPDAAPHEAFHAVQDVLGEQGNQAVDSIIKQNYGPEWDAIGNDYATNLVGPQEVSQKGWRNSILDRSGWGVAEAADKQYRDTFNRLSAETGAVPTSETVKSMIDTRTPWQSVLSPEESNAVADKYLARELAAENFDAVFKHSGNEGLTGNQKAPVISRLSNVVANLVSSLGGEPLAGRTSDIRQYPLKYEAAQGVTEAARAARAGNPAVEPKITAAGPRPAIGLPVTPAEQQNAADEAKKIAAEAPATPPVRPGEPPTTAGTKSPRELLGAMAEAIAARSGVKINYSSAPGEPAAAITSTRPIRRSIIEAFRTMPEAARALWEKNFFPERVIRTKSGYQVLGWAPEVFAANAHKLAQTLSDLGGTVASPYELDMRARSFSPAGWQELYNDVSKFVGNQMAGKTGAGNKLVVPESVIEKGFTAPPVSGGEGKLDQRKADFINMLYNFKLPETPRITSGKLPLNVAGQRISEATQSGRISSPVEPKAPYTGKAASALGIEGQAINEVNPFRSEVESAAKSAGVKMPSMVEAIQRLDLNHIKEVAGAPELPQFRGNTLTLTAGFQPKTQAGKDLESRGFEIERSALGKGNLLQYRVLDSSKNEVANLKVGVGPTSAHVESVYVNKGNRDTGIANTLYREMATDLQEKGISSLSGEVIHPAPAKIRAELFGPMKVSSEEGKTLHVESQIPLTAQFSPAEAMDSIKSEDTWNALKNYKGKYGGGVTGWAFDVGASARTPEDVQSFRNTNSLYAEMGREAMKNKDYDAAAQLFTKAQVAREAFEVATGQKIDGTPGASGGVEMLQRKDPNYIPPVLEKPEVLGQFQPSTDNRAIKAAAVKDKKTGKIFSGIAHFDAQFKAQDAGFSSSRDDYEDGFVTNSGEFLTRDAALERAKQLKQVPKNFESPFTTAYPDQTSGLHSTDLPVSGSFQPNAEVKKISEDYKKENEIKSTAPRLVPLNAGIAKDIADYYDEAKSDPKNPTVLNSYNALAKETIDQYKAITKAGYKIEPWTGKGEPYANSAAMNSDVRDNKHLFFKPTGSDISGENLMLRPSGISDFNVNDIFRAVHDFFGHAKEGNQFGPQGELNAWQEHSAMYSPEAQGALAAETLAQNSWVNFGKHLRGSSGDVPVKGTPGYAPLAERPFAEQKNIVIPPELIDLAHTQTPIEDARQTRQFVQTLGQAQPNYNKNEDLLSFEDIMEGKANRSSYWISPDGGIYDAHDDHRAWAKKFIDTSPSDDPILRAIKEKWARVNFFGDTDLHVMSGPLTRAQWTALKDWSGARNLEVFTVNPNNLHSVQFQPKSAKEDAFNLKPASNGFSKAWILPDGTPVQLGGQWHHEWLAENPDIAKKYGIKKATAESDTSRTDALAKGFARINYDAKTGTITVEAREKDLPNLRPSLEKFMQANLPQIDRAQFYLFNDKVNQIADSGSATLFDKPKAERLAAIPFLNAPGDITELSPQATAGALSEQGAPGAAPKRGRGQFQAKREQRPEQQTLEGVGGREPLSTMAIANMTKNEIAEHYPEAVIERRKFEPISSNIIDSPLAKSVGSEEKAVDAYAKKLVEFAREKENTPEYKSGQKWYRDFVPQLKKEFGKDATIFAELLAATSPNTGVTTNFGYAYDALQGLRSGRFRKIIPKFEEGLQKIADDSWEPWLRREVKAGNATGETPAAFLARWIEKHNLKPTQSNGSLYGQHSVPVLSVFARQWMDRNTGPKTRTFVSNLLGTGHDATIDVWADRTMRRLGYEGFNDRWRILPQNSTGVSDADFYFSQKAFRKAASELGMNADDLQGALWFAEKQHWADNGWGRLDLGSFSKEMEKLPLLRAGVEQRLNTTAAKSKVNPLTAGELGLSVEPRKLK